MKLEGKNKPKIIKDYDKLTDEMLEQIKLIYPKGFRRHLVTFTGLDGKQRKGLPFETEEKIYLIRMTTQEAIHMVAADDDYNDNGLLKPNVQARLADKYDEEDHLEEYNSNDDNDYGENEAMKDISSEELDGDVADELYSLDSD